MERSLQTQHKKKNSNANFVNDLILIHFGEIFFFFLQTVIIFLN